MSSAGYVVAILMTAALLAGCGTSSQTSQTETAVAAQSATDAQAADPARSVPETADSDESDRSPASPSTTEPAISAEGASDGDSALADESDTDSSSSAPSVTTATTADAEATGSQPTAPTSPAAPTSESGTETPSSLAPGITFPPDSVPLGQLPALPDGALNGFVWPVNRSLTLGLGNATRPVYEIQSLHPGIDIPAPHGTDIVAAAAGTVTFAADRGGTGLTTVIDHGNGITSTYGHQSELLVSKGMAVDTASVIGRVGSTGDAIEPQLRLEIWIEGSAYDPRLVLP